MDPFYEWRGITIYHGDCRDVLPFIAADVLVTDPPYGVNLGKTAGTVGHGLLRRGYADYEDTIENYRRIVVPAIQTALAMTKRGAVFVTTVGMSLLPMARAVGGVYSPACAGGRHAWGFKNYHPILYYGSGPRVHLGSEPDTYRSTAVAEVLAHPCPKPIEWMRWLVQFASEPTDVILDPFMGSGTTLRAAKDCGRRAIGIEISESYCEIAAKRLAQDVLLVA